MDSALPLRRMCFLTLSFATLTCLESAAHAAAPAPTAVLSFEQAVDMAVASSLERKQAESELEAQTARRRQAQSDYGPRVDASAAAEDFDKPANVSLGAATFLVRPEQLRTGNITIKQPLTGLYSTWQHSGMEKSQEEIAKLGVELKRSEAAFAAATAYRRVQEATEKQKIAEASIVATESQARDARALVDSGRLIKSDLLKIEIAKQEAKAALAKAVAARQKALANLVFLINVPSSEGLVLDPLPKASDSTRVITETAKLIMSQTADLKATVEKAQDSRLELKQAALMVEKADYGKRMTDWNFAPHVDALVSWDRYYDTPPFGNPLFTRTYAIQASWELWDNGSRVFAHHEAAANAQKAETAVQAAKDRLRLDLTSVLADLEAAKDALAATEATVAQAEEAYRLDKARFSSGLVTATDLVLSETAQTRARGELVSALTEVDVLNLMTQKVMGELRPRATLH